MHVSDFEHFIATVDTRKYDCVQDPVRQHKSGGVYRATIVAAFVSTLTAVVYCKVKD